MYARNSYNCASRILENFVPPYESTVTKLAEAGAVMVGKTNLDEFAMAVTENSAYQVTANPWDVSQCRRSSVVHQL